MVVSRKLEPSIAVRYSKRSELKDVIGMLEAVNVGHETGQPETADTIGRTMLS